MIGDGRDELPSVYGPQLDTLVVRSSQEVLPIHGVELNVSAAEDLKWRLIKRYRAAAVSATYVIMLHATLTQPLPMCRPDRGIVCPEGVRISANRVDPQSDRAIG